jgi:hypothetical protein
MGSLYRPKFRSADGTLKVQTFWWIKYRDALGVLRRESKRDREGARSEAPPEATRGRGGRGARDRTSCRPGNGRRAS